MKRFSILLTTALLASLCSSCQLYKSQGRKNFEADTDGRLQKTTFGSGALVGSNSESGEHCTLMDVSKFEELIQASASFTITAVNESQVQVCQDPNQQENTQAEE